MKFNFTPRNIAIAILLILTLILGIVSIIIATRLGQQSTVNVAGNTDSHGCNLDKGESWCDNRQECVGGQTGKTCEISNPPPGTTTCTVQYGNGTVSIPNIDACNGKTLTCYTYHGSSDATCSSNKSGPQTIGKGQSISVTAACGECAQVDCNDGGGSRVNGGACQPPPNNPPPVTLVCGDAKCKTGELCERTTAGGSTYKLCTSADITAGRAPTGATESSCIISSCTLTAVQLSCGDALCRAGEACERTSAGATTYKSCTSADITAGTAPTGAASDCNINSCTVNPVVVVSTPLPSTAVFSDDFDRLLVGFMLVILGLLAYRFNLIGKVFENLNGLTEDDAIKHSTLNRFLKSRRDSFEKKVEEDLRKEK